MIAFSFERVNHPDDAAAAGHGQPFLPLFPFGCVPSVVACSQSVVGFMRLSRCANVGREEGGRLRSNNAIRNAMDGAADGEAEEDGHGSTAALSFLLCRLASLIHPVSSSLSESRSAVVPASRGISLDPDSGIL